MAKIKQNVRTLDDEFTKPKEKYSPSELVSESAILKDLYQKNGSKKLMERYLHFKKAAGTKDRRIVSVLDAERFTKYSAIYSTWASANLPKHNPNK